MTFRDLQALADDVFLYPHGGDPQNPQAAVGLIRLPDQSILIDAGNSPRHAQMLAAEMVSWKPVQTIIYTHHHWDHTFGAASFRAPIVIGHEACAPLMRQSLLRLQTMNGVRDDIYRNPLADSRNEQLFRLFGDLRDFQLLTPTVAFATRMALHLHGLTLELEHIGGAHAEDSIIIKLPQHGIMFLGDCFYLPRQSNDPAEKPIDRAMLRRIADPTYHTYVHGHDVPLSYAELLALLED